MADNVDATAGVGITFRTDDVGAGVQVPYTKLMSGVDGASDLIGGDAANGLDVDVTRVIPGTAATSLGKAEDAQHTSGDVGVLALAVRADAATALAAHDNDYGPLITDGTGRLYVSATAVGTIADDAATPGAPVMTGGKAVEMDGTDPTSVAEDDVAIFRTDLQRRLLVNNSAPNVVRASLQHDAAVTDHALIATPGANLSLYITSLTVSNGATAGYVFFEEDTAGAKTVLIDRIYLGINQGCHLTFPQPLRLTHNVDLGFTSVTVTTHTVTALGYAAP